MLPSWSSGTPVAPCTNGQGGTCWKRHELRLDSVVASESAAGAMQRRGDVESARGIRRRQTRARLGASWQLACDYS